MDTTLRPLPGFSSYGVTEEGAVVNIRTGYSLKPFKRGKNYLYVRLYTGKGTESIERSVAACVWAAQVASKRPIRVPCRWFSRKQSNR